MIFLVRHGEADHHINDLTGGWTDSALTDKGRDQIGKAADYIYRMTKGRLPRIISSDLRRASQSAEIIATKYNTDYSVHEFLREKNNGDAAGMKESEAKKIKLKAILHDPDLRNYPNGETRREFFDRVANGMRAIEHSHSPLVIVSHKGTVQNILFWWLNLSVDDAVRLSISFGADAASVSILNINKWSEHEITVLNHLP